MYEDEDALGGCQTSRYESSGSTRTNDPIVEQHGQLRLADPKTLELSDVPSDLQSGSVWKCGPSGPGYAAEFLSRRKKPLALPEATGTPISFAGTPSGDHLAIVCSNYQFVYAYGSSGRLLWKYAVAGRDRIVALAWAPDGSKLAAAHWTGELTILDGGTGRSLRTLQTAGSVAWAMCFDAAGRHLAWGDEPYTKISDLASNAPDVVLLRGSGIVRFSPDGTRLLTGTADGSLSLWHSETGKEMLKLPRLSSAVANAEFSPDSQRIFATDMSGSLYMDRTGAAE